LAEARFYAAAGFTDILYAITLSSNAVAGVVQLHQQSCDLHVLLENTAVVNTLNEQLGLSGMLSYI
jgi:D-serine deaminase-like pyridoxal phosphate-dependent protein